MSTPKYRTTPLPSSEMPPGIPYIIGNEAAERFSFYGMRAILVIFMTTYLMGPDGNPAPMGKSEAVANYHLFNAAVYFLPLAGALLSDLYWGKYRTILILSIVYCFGHLALALDDTRFGLAIGLGLIAIGSGGIKPCVSANVGDQFGPQNRHLLERVYSWFYVAINLGAAISSFLTPELLDHWGPHVAFAVPGILMLVATVVFWLGRNKFVHIPPGRRKFLRELVGREGLHALGRLSVVYLFAALFWSLYDQSGSAWVLQAKSLDRNVLGHEFLPSEIQAVNPVFILILVPCFSWFIYPAMNRVFPLTSLRKIAIGLFLTALSFVVSAWIEQRITLGEHPHVTWQVLAYAILTASEVMVSITLLEFSYTQAPKTMKSAIMALYLLSVSVGNLFTFLVNRSLQTDRLKMWLQGANYYWFFASLMLIASLLFIVVARRFRPRTYLQGTDAIDAA